MADHDDDRATTVAAFKQAVNMTPAQLEQWLDDARSQEVGVTSGGDKKSEAGGGESVGHASGRRIVGLLRSKDSELTDDDLAHMRKVTGYVHRHLAQRPEKEEIEGSRWRASLMNWGHDPLKD